MLRMCSLAQAKSYFYRMRKSRQSRRQRSKRSLPRVARKRAEIKGRVWRLEGPGEPGKRRRGAADTSMNWLDNRFKKQTSTFVPYQLLQLSCDQSSILAGFWGFGEIGRASCRERVC